MKVEGLGERLPRVRVGRAKGSPILGELCGLEVVGCAGGGGHVAAVFFAGVLVGAGAELAARVLPAFADVVPVESELGELSAELLGGLLGEGDPDPLAYYFGKLVGLGKPLAKHSQDFIGGESAVGLALFEVHVRPGAFANGS